MRQKALIAMSGGVDSAVAAYLMVQQGYDSIGVTMRLLNPAGLSLDEDNTCCSSQDIEDARRVADRLGIPYHVVDFSERFRSCVVDRFVRAYEDGLTPNPCIECNRYLKFEQMFEEAETRGCDYIVTGHYARVEQNPISGRFELKKGLDEGKDQSYVLYSLTQRQLEKVRFPLGGLPKAQVRAIAKEQQFINADKKESQDICFVPNGDYTAFIRDYTGKTYPDGNFVDRDGNVLGTHKGLIRYTIGQRKGLGLALPAPMYVCEKRVEQNEVVLCTDADLFSCTLTATNVNWIAGTPPTEPLDIAAKIRYRHAEQPARVTPIGEDAFTVDFYEPQRAITKGQAVVLYDGDTVLGGGTIV